MKRLIFIYTHDPLKEILKENRYITPREADEIYEILGYPPIRGGYWPENKKDFAEAYEKCFKSRWPQ